MKQILIVVVLAGVFSVLSGCDTSATGEPGTYKSCKAAGGEWVTVAGRPELVCLFIK